MKPRKVITALTVIFYSVSIFNVVAEHGGAVIVNTIIHVVTYYRENPWDILGLPFLLVAVGMTCWLVVDYFRQRKREKLRRETVARDNLVKRLVRDARQKETIVNALNEVRAKLDLPEADIYRHTDRGQ